MNITRTQLHRWSVAKARSLPIKQVIQPVQPVRSIQRERDATDPTIPAHIAEMNAYIAIKKNRRDFAK